MFLFPCLIRVSSVAQDLPCPRLHSRGGISCLDRFFGCGCAALGLCGLFATIFRRSEVANPDLQAMFTPSGKMRRAFLFYAAALSWELLAGPSPAQPPSAPEHFRFRFPQPATYRLDERGASRPASAGPGEWLGAWREDGSSNRVEFGSRVVLEIDSTNRLRQVLEGSPLMLSRVVASNVFILQA